MWVCSCDKILYFWNTWEIGREWGNTFKTSPNPLSWYEHFRARDLTIDVWNLLNFGDSKLHMTLTKVPKSYGEPNIVAEYIVLWLETRVSFRRTMKKPTK